MLLRPRQKLFVERSLRALAEHGNTPGVAPTGAGKTIMLSAAVGEQVGRTSVGQDAATPCLVLLPALHGLLEALGAELALHG